MGASVEFLLGQIQRLLSSASAAVAGDAVLLERFASQGDESAFAALLARHGPMVYGVCRRVLHDRHQAEDAFQATFLVLARKARTLRRPQSLAAWLYGTARHLALKLRRGDARRRQRETECLTSTTSSPDPLDELAARELLLILDEEMERLPEKYRLPLLLCGLEGHPQEEVARILGCTLGSLKGRLERGRKRLHDRLTRRGLAFSGASVTAAVSHAGSVNAAARLTSTTLQAALAFSRGEQGGIAATVLALTETGVTSMAMTKAKLGLALLLALSLAAGTSALVYPGRSEQQPETKQPETSKSPKPEMTKRARHDLHGDPLPPGALARMGTIRFRHGNWIVGLTVSADGRTLAAADRDQTIRLWDAATGGEIRRLPGHEISTDVAALGYLRFLPDGKLLAAGVSPSGTPHLWDAVTGKKLRDLQGPFAAMWLGHIAFSADGQLMAGAANKIIMVWETATGRLLHKLDNGEEKLGFDGPIAFSPDGRLLASGGRGEILRLWNVKTGKEELRFVVQTPWPKEKTGPPHYFGLVDDVAFSPDGRTLASAARNSLVRLWDVATGKEIRSLRSGPSGAYSLAYSPDGKTLATGEVGAVRLWETVTGKELRQIQTVGGLAPGLAFLRGGEALATSEEGTIRLWDVRTGAEILPERGHSARIFSSALSTDGRTLITGSIDGTIRWWDLATGKELRRFAASPEAPELRGAMFLSPNGTKAAYFTSKMVGEKESEMGIELWDLIARKKLALLWRPNIFGAQFSPDGKTLFTHVWDVKESSGLIIAWDTATGKELRTLAEHSNSYDKIQLADDGTILAVVPRATEEAILLLDVATGKELCRVPVRSAFYQEFAVSPNNKLLAVVDGTRRMPDSRVLHQYIGLWDIAIGKEVRRFGRCSRGYSAVAFSADGRTVATAGKESQIRLWETATGSERLHLAGHTGGYISRLLFAENDRTLISTGSDTTALVWDLTGLRKPTSTPDGESSSRSLQELWDALAGDATVAYRAICTLTASPREAVAFLRKNLRRVEPVEEKTITELVLDLDSADFATRERALEELTKLDHLAEPALRKAQTGQPSLELRRRVQQLLEKLAATPSGAQLRPLRAVEVLERIGTPEAQQVLEKLAAGAAEARLTQEAKASLVRLAARRSIRP